MEEYSKDKEILDDLQHKDYKYGFSSNVETDIFPPGLNEDIIRRISAVKEEPKFLLEWRLKAYRHWLTMEHPKWAHISFPMPDFQSISYYAQPSNKPKYESLDEVDPEILATFNKLGIPLEEQKILSGVAVDAVFDSVSVHTQFREQLQEKGIIFCS
ncbi:MAG TPA: Fe-S cluster assembly protein SufB, partial [Bacteroidales bacterium]|nr:Fe-S cluster assembly protein SufB [Bacteroidales bacterium]